MNREQLEKEYLEQLKDTILTEKPQIEKVEDLQAQIDNSPILKVDDETRQKFVEEAKRQMQEDEILKPYVDEQANALINRQR